MQLECFLWDLDGVLTDTTMLHRNAWIDAIMTESGFEDIELTDELFDKYFLGVPRIVGIRRFLIDNSGHEALTPDEVETKTEIISGRKNEIFRSAVKKGSAIKVYDDAIELLKWAKMNGIKNGLASQSENAEYVVMQTNLDKYLDSMATGKTAKKYKIKPKPNKEFYLHAADQASSKVANCIAIEDSYVGAASAITAGAGMCIGVARRNASYMELLAAGCNIVTRELICIKDIIDLGIKS